MGVKHRKAKGNATEEYVAKQMRTIYNLTEDDVYRAPHSGMSKKELGDIYIRKAIRDDFFPFIIECKNQEGWDFRSLWPNLNTTIMNWYNQVVKDCIGTSYSPILVVTKAYYPYYLIIHEDTLKFDSISCYKSRTYLKCSGGFYIFELTDFLTYIKDKPWLKKEN